MRNIPNIIFTELSGYDLLDPYTDILSDIEIKRIQESPNNQNWRYISLYKDLSKEFFNYLSFNHIMCNDNISNDIKDYCKMFI